MIKWKGMEATIGIVNRDTDVEITIGTAERFMSATTSSLAQMRKEEILYLLNSVGRRERASLRKNELISRCIEQQHCVRRGEVSFPAQNFAPENEMTRYNNKAVKLKRELLKASLESWEMKPLVATAGMKEGTLNEIQVLRALPKFSKQTKHQISLQISLYIIVRGTRTQ